MVNPNNYLEVKQLYACQVFNEDVNSSYVDLAGYEGCTIIVTISAFSEADGSNYLTPILEESDTTTETDFTTATDVVSDPAFSVIDSTDEDAVTQVSHYIGSKRYVQVKFDETGTVTTAYVSAVAILTKAMRNPPSAPTTGTSA